MGYQLGIDFGTTFTAAVVRRAAGDEPEVVPLGGRGGTVSSVLHLARDERVTVGEAAAGLAGIDPTRVVRALKRHVGDPEPVVVGGHPFTAEELSARLLRWVVDRVVEQEDAAPAGIAVAHPLSWDEPTLDRFGTALAAHDLDVTFVAEPHAVAHAAAGATAPGDTVAVHDLGGGRFDAAVLRRDDAFTVLGAPESITDLGGLDLDELVWQHVRTALSDEVPPVARVRRACNRAKETLSVEDEVVVRIRRDEFRGAVHLDRATFEGLIAPQVDRTVAALRRTIASAGVEPGQLAALLLVGGSARIPLVARTVAEQLGRTPTVHADADLVARGAVLALASAPVTAVPVAAVTAPDVDPDAPTVVLAVPTTVDAPTTPLRTPAAVAPVAAAVPAAAVPAVPAVPAAAVAEPAGPPAPPATAASQPAPVTPAPVTPAPVTPTPPTPAPRTSAPSTPTPAPMPTPTPVPATPTPLTPTPRTSAGRGRAAAVLDPVVPPSGRRSLSRTLVGVGALIVAALVLVALFRPDGPLDPPLDAVAGDGASRVPAAVTPSAAEIEAALEPDEPRTPPRPAGVRPSVTTTPPAAPPTTRSVRAGAPPTGVTPPPPAV